jgi:predicted transcriptional regulator
VRLAKIVLAELNKVGGLRRTDLEKHIIIKYGTHATFDNVLGFLKERGYVEKASAKHTGPYRITERGKRFLEAI